MVRVCNQSLCKLWVNSRVQVAPPLTAVGAPVSVMPTLPQKHLPALTTASSPCLSFSAPPIVANVPRTIVTATARADLLLPAKPLSLLTARNVGAAEARNALVAATDIDCAAVCGRARKQLRERPASNFISFVLLTDALTCRGGSKRKVFLPGPLTQQSARAGWTDTPSLLSFALPRVAVRCPRTPSPLTPPNTPRRLAASLTESITKAKAKARSPAPLAAACNSQQAPPRRVTVPQYPSRSRSASWACTTSPSSSRTSSAPWPSTKVGIAWAPLGTVLKSNRNPKNDKDTLLVSNRTTLLRRFAGSAREPRPAYCQAAVRRRVAHDRS